MKSSKWMNGWMDELLDRHVLNLQVVLEYPSAEFHNQWHNMDDPSLVHVVSIEVNLCSFLVPLVFAWEKKTKKKKKRGVFAPGFFKVKHAVWQPSAVKKATPDCLSGVCNNPVQSKKPHLICLSGVYVWVFSTLEIRKRGGGQARQEI